MAACLPPDTIAIAGIRPRQIRDGALYRSLPAAWVSALEPYRDAGTLWIAYNGREIVLIAVGQAAGQPTVVHGISLSGSDRAVRAALQQHATHRTGAPALMTKAAPVVAQPIWLVLRGDTRLPLSGNGVNLQRALSFTEYTTASAGEEPEIRIHLTGFCATSELARHLEESLRAMVTLAASAIHEPYLKPVLGSVQIRREASNVEITLKANSQVLQELLK